MELAHDEFGSDLWSFTYVEMWVFIIWLNVLGGSLGTLLICKGRNHRQREKPSETGLAAKRETEVKKKKQRTQKENREEERGNLEIHW